MAKQILDAALLRELLHYDSDTGLFRWCVKPARRIAIGSLAGSTRKDGYVRVGIATKPYLAHRLAWLYAYGDWPKEEIDHIDGDPNNNRISNLRDVSRSTNKENQHRATRVNKSSGVLGVTWARDKGKWKAAITVKGQMRHIAYCETIAQASIAYLEAKRRWHAGCTI